MKDARNVDGDRILQKNAEQVKKQSGFSDLLKEDANELFDPAAEDVLLIEGNLEVENVLPIEGILEVETDRTIDIENIEVIHETVLMMSVMEGITQAIEKAFHLAEIIIGKTGTRSTRGAQVEIEKEIIVIKMANIKCNINQPLTV